MSQSIEFRSTQNYFHFFFRKLVTITAERLSDKSLITFTFPSNKKIKDLRALLNHHLPPCVPDKFDLYSFERGALIHYRPPTFRLDYFPVIFDQSVLSLKMDDRFVNIPRTTEKSWTSLRSSWKGFNLLKKTVHRLSTSLRRHVRSQSI